MRQPKRKARRVLSMTSLIDVIFLLLLFFMLTSTFTRFGEIPLVQAGQSGETEVSADTLRVFIRLLPTGATLNGQPVETNGIDAALRETLTQLRANSANAPDTALAFLSVGQSVTSQDFMQVFARLQTVPNLTVSVLQ